MVVVSPRTCPPAPHTAAAGAGVAAEPIVACTIGTLIPGSAHSGVVSAFISHLRSDSESEALEGMLAFLIPKRQSRVERI